MQGGVYEVGSNSGMRQAVGKLFSPALPSNARPDHSSEETDFDWLGVVGTPVRGRECFPRLHKARPHLRPGLRPGLSFPPLFGALLLPLWRDALPCRRFAGEGARATRAWSTVADSS